MMLGSESLRAAASLAAASWTEVASKLVPLVPPRRMTWTSGLPFVRTIAARPDTARARKPASSQRVISARGRRADAPCEVMPRKACGQDEARMASTATPTEPSVPFLKPIGNETPEASSLSRRKEGSARQRSSKVEV